MDHGFSTQTADLESSTPTEVPDTPPEAPLFPMSLQDTAKLIKHGVMPSEAADRARDAVSEVIGRRGYPPLPLQSPTRRPDMLYRIRLLGDEPSSALVLYSPRFDTTQKAIMPHVIYRVDGLGVGEMPEVYGGAAAALNTTDLVLEAADSLWFDLTEGRSFGFPTSVPEHETQAEALVDAWASTIEWDLGIDA